MLMDNYKSILKNLKPQPVVVQNIDDVAKCPCVMIL